VLRDIHDKASTMIDAVDEGKDEGHGVRIILDKMVVE